MLLKKQYTKSLFKFKGLALLLLALAPLACSSYTVVHYNIKELDSQKLRQNSEQVGHVKNVLGQFDYDILSLNEVQYDLPSVPSQDYQSTGKNIELIKQILNKNSFESVFYPANTGLRAKRKKDGTYATNPNSKEARSLGDQQNFGIFPAEYSTALMSRFPIKKIVEIHDLKWKTFNPQLNLKPFANAQGRPLSEEMELFDKNFTDATLLIEGKEVHLILLHTVPAYHFGNKKSVNLFRNLEQLRFLEWYLSGETDRQIPTNLPISPLAKDSNFIALGDFNTGYLSSASDQVNGSQVLARLKQRFQFWMQSPDFSNESDGFSPAPMRLQLDYIIFSGDLQVVDGGIAHPESHFTDLGCNSSASPKAASEMLEVSYKKDGEICRAYVTREYFEAKKSSDHFPLWAKFKIK